MVVGEKNAGEEERLWASVADFNLFVYICAQINIYEKNTLLRSYGTATPHRCWGGEP